MAAYSDLRAMVIDNVYSILVAATFVVCYGALTIAGASDIFSPLWSHIGAGLVMFALTFGLFAAGMLGGADSKLASALALWTGLKGLPVFLVFMTLIGGVLGLMALLLARRPVVTAPMEGSWLARAQNGESKVPYGVAIAGGALIAFIELGYVSPELLGAF